MRLHPFRPGTILVSTAAVLTLAGCTGRAGGPREPTPMPVPIGDNALAPAVRGLTLLVVGDSWARHPRGGVVAAPGPRTLGAAAPAADRDRRNVVVNASRPGCGLMQPVRVRRQGRLVA